jgi:hypothetical protein
MAVGRRDIIQKGNVFLKNGRLKTSVQEKVILYYWTKQKMI